MQRKSPLSKIILAFVATIAMLISFVPASTARAAGNDVSNNVTSLTVNPTHINDSGKTTVSFTFDDYAQKIHGGDTITVNWTNSGTVYGVRATPNLFRSTLMELTSQP
ncbi:hypothetical protein ACFQY8_07045 [Alloscardovia venturai]|uniref:Uncharacterized protein n=1 Tax=Alloscardovia venturai TaxID=1769421 RepID=A0ABW2Y5G4_9BIFI